MDRELPDPYASSEMRRAPLLALTALSVFAGVLPLSAQEPTLTLDVSPAVFSPNGDGRVDETTIAVTTTLPGQVTIRILAGTEERRRWEQEVVEPGEVEVTWRGRATDETTRLPDGTYTVEATFTDPVELTSETRLAQVTIDTRRPGTSWVRIRPKPGTGRRTWRFTIRLADRADVMAVRLTVTDPVGQSDEMELDLPAGTSVIEWRPEIRGRALPPRTYRARVRATDDVGNRGTFRTKRFRVERPVNAHVFRRLSGTGRRVALTIDDCHVPSAWSRMLTTLRSKNVLATFFCPADRIAMYPSLARRTVREGHTLAAHGYDHADLSTLGYDAVVKRLRADADTAWRVARVTTAPYMRPPYGAYDSTVIRAAGRTAHGRVMMWDVDAGDIWGAGTAAIRSNVVGGARRGSVILMHTMDSTASALPGIIDGLRARGLRPVSLPRLFLAAGYI